MRQLVKQITLPWSASKIPADSIPDDIEPFGVKVVNGRETRFKRVAGTWSVGVYRKSYDRVMGSREGWRTATSPTLEMAIAEANGRDYPNLSDNALAYYVLDRVQCR